METTWTPEPSAECPLMRLSVSDIPQMQLVILPQPSELGITNCTLYRNPSPKCMRPSQSHTVRTWQPKHLESYLSVSKTRAQSRQMHAYRAGIGADEGDVRPLLLHNAHSEVRNPGTRPGLGRGGAGVPTVVLGQSQHTDVLISPHSDFLKKKTEFVVDISEIGKFHTHPPYFSFLVSPEKAGSSVST